MSTRILHSRIPSGAALALATLYWITHTAIAEAEVNNDHHSTLSALAIGNAELDLQRAREGLHVDGLAMQLGEIHTDATINDNVLNAEQTGLNSVGSGAFSHASGLVFSVQNSGNHVIIQNTTLINVNMQP
ncbi:MAG: hypothetical protein ACK5ME_11815 [Parahaliea sp.]